MPKSVFCHTKHEPWFVSRLVSQRQRSQPSQYDAKEDIADQYIKATYKQSVAGR